MTACVRGFLFAGLAGAMLALAAPAAAENITIPAQGSIPAITGNLARPAGPGPFPAVLVLHGCERHGAARGQDRRRTR
jgi:hypothetical protein